MASKTLRAVKPGEKAEPKRKKSVSEAAESGSHRELLVAMRTRLAKAVEEPNTPARDLAALTRRLHEVAKEIEAIDSREGGDDIGDAAATPDEAFDTEAL